MEENRIFGCLSAAALKWIAMLTMLVDHIGAVFVTGPAYIWLRLVGRMAFPIYCFLLAEGIAHTRSRLKYALRLLVCALVTEPLFDFALRGTWFDPAHQNVLWTLFLGLVAVCLGDFRSRRWKDSLLSVGGMAISLLVKVLALVSLAGLADFVCTDYGWYGVAMIAAFYYLRRFHWLACVAAGALTLLQGGLQMYAVLALAYIGVYNGRKGRSSRWFYLFYPAHLAVLGALAVLV